MPPSNPHPDSSKTAEGGPQEGHDHKGIRLRLLVYDQSSRQVVALLLYFDKSPKLLFN